MQPITWYPLLAAAVLSTTIAGQSQAPRAPMPEAKVRELATIEAETSGWGVVQLPSGRSLIYRVDNTTFAYDIATKKRTLIGTNMTPWSVSSQGDRFAFSRPSEDRMHDFAWTMPIDPATGIATGPAQRVSLRPSGRRGVFSPDGKTLAFVGARNPDGTWDVVLVPATGGAERVVTNYPGRGGLAWSADGKWLYVETVWSDENAIERVPLTGGRSERVFPHTLGTDAQAVGLSPDARVAFFHENPDRFFYRTASGVEGEVSVALPALDDGDGYNMQFTAIDSMRFTFTTQIRNQRVRVLDLATGQARELLPGTVQSSMPAWSPDGRRLAVLSGDLSHCDITIVNADGSSPRRYPLSLHLDGWGSPGVWERPWSPDGRFLAFRAKTERDGRQKVARAPDDQYQLAVLDVESGTVRMLASSPARYQRFAWRTDGKAIRTVKHTTAPIGSPSGAGHSLVEIPLNGPERQLRDISAEFPHAFSATFLSDREAIIMETPNWPATVSEHVDRFVVPLDGGTARRLPDPGNEPGSRIGGTLVAGNRMLIGQVDARGEARVIKIVSTVDNSTGTLRLPFDGRHGVPHPDGKQIINVGKANGDSGWKLFLVPLDGSATRVIGEIPHGTGGLLAPSPDGKLLAYTSDGKYVSTIHEIDFGPALQAIVK
jgi:Tol biopolymer transport system component